MKEPYKVLVMTTCKCRENNTNIVMTRTWFDETLQNKIAQGARQEQARIVDLLLERSNATSKETLIALIKGQNK
jgi:hypothetical protein